MLHSLYAQLLKRNGERIMNKIDSIADVIIYYIVRKFLGHKKTLEVVETLTEMTEIIGTTKEEIIQALKNDFKDFEDSIQYSSALTIKDLDAIITRNIKDYRNSTIAVMTPLNFLNLKDKNES